MELGSCLTYAAETDIRQAAKCNDYQELLKSRKLQLSGWSRSRNSIIVSQSISTASKLEKMIRKTSLNL